MFGVRSAGLRGNLLRNFGLHDSKQGDADVLAPRHPTLTCESFDLRSATTRKTNSDALRFAAFWTDWLLWNDRHNGRHSRKQGLRARIPITTM